MSDNIGARLCDHFRRNGFYREGLMHKFNLREEHFSGVVDDFFKSLVASKEITTYNYDECYVYEDVCGTFYCISFAWSDGKSIDMLSFDVEE